MSLKQKRLLWFFVWLFIILSGPITVLRNTNIAEVRTSGLLLLTTFQRASGLLAFSLLFIQIMLGSFMQWWLDSLGAKAFRLHTREGLLTYGFVFIHPIFQYLIAAKTLGFANYLAIPMTNYLKAPELWISFGRVALALLTIGVAAAYFRTKPILRKNWRALHIVNYFAFFLVAIHAGRLGTDVGSLPFSLIYWLGIATVALTVVHRFVWSGLKSRANIKI